MTTQSKAVWVILSLFLIFLLGPAPTPARAVGSIVIGDGTPESCDIWQTVLELQQAIADIDPGGTITFNCGPDPVTIWVAEIEIYKDLTIDGGGLITFTGGTGSGCAICVLGDATVQLLNLSLADAYSACDGALYNTGTLTLRHVTVARNSTDHGCSAGGIGNAGTLIIEDSFIVENYTSCDQVQCGWGGGIANGGTLRITNSTISGNSSALYGGGIWNSGSATIENSTISGNHSGCQTEYDETGEPYTVCFPGGGIRNLGTMTIINSTISGNSSGENGGGISNAGTLILQNTTIADNTAQSGAGLANENTITSQNSILAANNGANNQPSDCSGTLTSQGYNLIGTTTGCTITSDTTGNLLNVDPLLGLLQDNGGTSFTQAPLPGSPVIDAGNPAAPGSGGTACEATDQRGVARPQDGDGDGLARCDIGAVEGAQTSLVPVQIDIKPGDDTNRIHLKSKGPLPVAILSSSTFDATTVDPALTKFGPNEASPESSSLRDVNGDGRLDLLLRFRTQQTGIQPDDTQACLTGQTSSGMSIQGCDLVLIVLPTPPSNPGPPTRPGLILWNKLGSDDEVLNSAYGPDLGFFLPGDCYNNGCDALNDLIGNPGYVPGVFGDALTLAPGPYYTYARVHAAVLRNANDYISPEQGAVAIWFQESADPLPYSYGLYRLFDGPWGLGDTLGLWVQAQDMTAPTPARLMFSMGGTCAVTSKADGQPGVAISAYNNTWIHVAAVWDRKGIEGSPETLRLYVNGAVAASESCMNWSTDFSQAIDIGGGNDGEIAGKFAVDNLKVWNFAKTDYSDRFVEGSKK